MKCFTLPVVNTMSLFGMILLLCSTVVLVVDSHELPAIRCESYVVNTTANPSALGCPKDYDIVSIVIGHALNEMSYKKKWIDPIETSAYPDIVKDDVLVPRLGECVYGCEDDNDCAPGLYCSSGYKNELKKKDYDKRTANCNNPIMTSNMKKNGNFCFRKEILNGRRLRQSSTSQLHRSSSTVDDVADVADDVDEEEETSTDIVQHRKLGCGQCSPYCRIRPNAPACIVLNCDDCRRRQLSNNGRVLQDSATTTAAATDAGIMTGEPDIAALIELATSKLREMAGWTNITDPDCMKFLQTASCTI